MMTRHHDYYNYFINFNYEELYKMTFNKRKKVVIIIIMMMIKKKLSKKHLEIDMTYRAVSRE